MPADRLIHPKLGKSRKVSLLTDLEYRVWTQYILSADDFGVMHATAVKIQSDNLHLANRPAKMVKRCLDALVKCGLLHAFTHQGQPFVFQHDWQRWQKVEYPRATDNPSPPNDALEACDEATLALFAKHPGGQRKDRRRADDDPSDLGRASQTHTEGVPPTRARGRAERLTATGSTAIGTRLTADGDAAPLDLWLAKLRSAYPVVAVTSGYATETAFTSAVMGDSRGPKYTFEAMLTNLENQKRGHQWRVKGMVPRLDKWLREGLWQQQHDERPPAAEQMSKSTSVTLDAAAEILSKRPA